jgi:hypothetical protein
MLLNLKVVITKINLYLFYIMIGIIFSWLIYIVSVSIWNTFCRGCPATWYVTNVQPLLPKPKIIIEEDDEDWEDSEF